MKTYAENRRARFDFEILETFEAGIELIGTEVKAIKTGRVQLAGAFAIVRGGEIFLVNTEIPPYQPKNAPPQYNPTRARKLLLNKKEIKYLIGKVQEANLTIVALKMYDKGGKIKVLLALAKGKKKADKRDAIKKREAEKKIRRSLKRG